MNFKLKTAVTLWNLFPFKSLVKQIIKKSSFFELLYKDLRFRGVMKLNIDGKSLKFYNPGFTTIENEIFWNELHSWEKTSQNLWIKLSERAECILDVGANSGVYSFVASTVNQNAEIFSFEPVLRTIELFEKNLSLNPNLNITLIKAAVSNKSGESIFYDLPTQSQYSASLNKSFYDNEPNKIEYKVETIKLDTFELLRNKKIDLIKLDVETHEPEAIEGMIEIIKNNRPTMLIEILSDNIANRIEELLKRLDYCYFNIDENIGVTQVSKLSKSKSYNFLICDKNIAKNLNIL